MPLPYDAKSSELIARWNIAAYLCVSAALLLVLAITAWGAYVDFSEVRLTLLQGELNRVRSHAVRTVARIQDRLGTPGATLNSAVAEDDWLRKYWDTVLPTDDSRPYAALVDRGGKILVHSMRKLEGGQLGQSWYDRVVLEIDDGDPESEDIVETRYPGLTGGRRVYDVRVPIIQHGAEIGDYHSALDYDWFKQQLVEKSQGTWTRWTAIFVVLLLIIGVAGVSLYNIVRRTILLRETIELARVKQFAELGELAAGIAHEIRNPINAIRLNLHALQRLQRHAAGPDNANGQGGQNGDDSVTVIAEANREIERVEGLMRIMLGYARPEKPIDEHIDLRSELDAAASFVRPVLERDRVCLKVHLPSTPLYVHLDRNRFRQIMLNLLTNAKEAVGSDGEIEVSLGHRGRDQVEIVVADNGPGVPPGDRDRIFDPFYSTKELGTGLGLALVKRFVDEAHGEIVCEANESSGARFRLSFPEVAAEGTPLVSAR
jgi:signal transduction histidine kinase